MKLLAKQLHKRSSGQTALEYFMVIALIIIPLAYAINAGVSGDEDSGHIVTRMTENSVGDNSRMGVIGRPYP